MKAMSEKIYLAGKVDSNEISIADFSEELEGRGHIVLEKWWEGDALPKPYLSNFASSNPAARKMIEAAYRSSVFILFPEDKILGAAIEFGSAIASTIDNSSKQVFVVNPFDKRQSVFYCHPSVTTVESLLDIRKMKWF